VKRPALAPAVSFSRYHGRITELSFPLFEM